MAYVAKTKAYTFDVNPSFTSDISMEVERKTEKKISMFYFSSQTGLAPGEYSVDAILSAFYDRGKREIESQINNHKRAYKADTVSLSIDNHGRILITSTIPESDADYEARRARTIKCRLSAEKRKLNLKEKKALKDKETVEKIFREYGIKEHYILNKVVATKDESKNQKVTG